MPLETMCISQLYFFHVGVQSANAEIANIVHLYIMEMKGNHRRS